MNLFDYEIFPSVAVSVDDDEHLGRIKVTIPGAETPGVNIKMERAPWCLPFTMSGGYQGFTKLVENSKVWVIRNRNNPYEMWYLPMVDLNDNTSEIAAAYDNTDILISRNCGGNNVYIYYTDGGGITLSIGEARVNVKSDGSIYVQDANGGQVTIKGGSVYLNTTSETFTPVRGQKMYDAITKYANAVTMAIGKIYPHGSAAVPDLTTAAADLSKALAVAQSCSDNIYIS